ncbi:MAG TPA: hypothetical protein VNM22_16965 [Candidatus Limnocylindrales bacterium]|nr:hypothetical protein [Candidatus Limnocylindrales bacterium]
MNSEFITFTPEEKAVLRNIEFFRLKTSITQKVLTLLTELHQRLKSEVRDLQFIAPPEFDLKNSQFVKGEHYRGFPYIYLDYPKCFNKVNILTFRWMLWWGHYFIFALMTQGPHSEAHRENLIQLYDDFADKGFYLSTYQSPWEWVRDVEYVVPLQHVNKSQVVPLLKEKSFLKLQRFVDLEDDVLNNKSLVEEGVQTFRAFKPLVVRSPQPLVRD